MLNFKAFFVFLTLILGFGAHTFGQVYDPVDWSYEVRTTDDKKAEVIFTATIEAGWHLYAVDLPSDEGPIPTSFTFDESADFKKVGKVKQGKYKTAYDPNFDMDLNYFDKKAVFTQTLERKSNEAFSVKGYLTFMVCNDEMCLPPEDIDFAIDVKASKPIPVDANGGEVKAGKDDKSTGISPAPISPISMGGASGDSVLLPATWTFAVANETDTSAQLIFEASIDKGWYVYSQNVDTNVVLGALRFQINESVKYSLVGPVNELDAKMKFDSIFEIEVAYFSGKAKFVQNILKRSTGPFSVSGYLTYTTCDGHKCLAPEDVDFNFELKAGTGATLANADDTDDESRSNWMIFIISFFSGFAALLTPCVFPMIPMTVSFFTKQSKTRAAGIRNAMLYGLSIIVIYVVLGVAVTAAFGASILSELSTDPWFNLFFFLLLIIFAVSFLGAFEITLPSSWINKADAQADRGGMIGIFFMAFTLALVSFSCTGPIVGTLIVEAAGKGGSAPAIGMLGFSLAIALPFTLFAAFPGWLNSLPQSGGWLNSVKVTLGFLELAFAFKFLSNADMVLQWHLLEREVYLAIWIVIFGMLTLYLLGKLKLAHDSDLPYISVTRIFLALVTGAFTIYLLPGLWGAPLKLISAFPPPLHYSESPQGVGFSGGAIADVPEGDDLHVGPQGIFVFHDYEKGMAMARERGVPAMLDFTGHACVNCRKMEMQVWSDPEIKRKLSEDLVLISLYVDERTPLPKEEQVEVELTGGRKKMLRNVGNKWAAFQEINYGINAQPYYVMLDHDENQLIEPANYQDYGKIDLFNDWLNRGLEAF